MQLVVALVLSLLLPSLARAEARIALLIGNQAYNAKVGPLQNLPKDASVDEKKLKQVEAIINSMTNEERRDHNVIDGKRRKRIAKGSGTTVQDVNQVIKQYMQMRQMMKQYGAMASRAKLKGLGKLAGLG